jgi:hypothetical protein
MATALAVPFDDCPFIACVADRDGLVKNHGNDASVGTAEPLQSALSRPPVFMPLRCDGFSSLQFDDLTGFRNPTFRLSYPTFKLGTGHLGISQLLTARLQLSPHFRQIPLGVSHLGSQCIQRELEIDHLRFYHRLQLPAGAGGKSHHSEDTEGDSAN